MSVLELRYNIWFSIRVRGSWSIFIRLDVLTSGSWYVYWNLRQLHKELYLDEKTMPHVYVIVSRIRAPWEKSIWNKIFEKILSSRTNLLFGPSRNQFPCCRTSVIRRVTTYICFYLTCSFAVWVHLTSDNLRWNSCIQLIQKKFLLYEYPSVRAQNT